MNTKIFSRIVLILALLGVVFGAAGIVSPALAQDNNPPVPDPGNGGNGDGNVVVVPETGGDQDAPAFNFWTLLIILGVVIVVLLIVVAARGSRY